MCCSPSWQPPHIHIPGPCLFSGLQREELRGQHQSPARPLSGGSVKIKHYCVRSGGDGVKSTHHSYLILMGLGLCLFLAVMFKQTVVQSVDITSLPDFELSQIKIKTYWLQWKRSPGETFAPDSARVGLVLLCYFADSKASLLAYGQWYRLRGVWNLINEHIHYRKMASAFARRQTASGILWLLTAGSHECLLSFFFFKKPSVEWTHSANGKKKKRKKTLLPAGVRKI